MYFPLLINHQLYVLDGSVDAAMQRLCVFPCRRLRESTQPYRQYRSRWQHKSS